MQKRRFSTLFSALAVLVLLLRNPMAISKTITLVTVVSDSITM